MGFIYTKPISIEEVFSKFDTNHDGKISGKEAKNAKKMDVFTNFKVKKGMTLQTFESTNTDVYARYEKFSTDAYNKQEIRIRNQIKSFVDAVIEMQEHDLEDFEILEKEVEKHKDELERTLEREKEIY